MAKGLDAGKAFLQGVLGKITDPGQRAAAETLLASETFLTEVGGGVLGQSEIDRQLQDLRTKTADNDTKAQQLDDRDAALTKWHGDLTGYRQELDEVVKVGTAAKKAGWKMGDPIPQTPLANGNGVPPVVAAGLTAEQLEQTLASERAAFLGYQVESNTLMREHFGKFGEILDVTPLIKHPEIGKLGLLGVYQIVHKDALAQKATEAAQSAEEKIRADERSKVMAAHANQLPYPLANGPGSGSPLDGLAAAPNAPKDVVGDAAAHYTRLQQGRPA